MRVAALYDIHGNLPALEAVLEEVETAQPDVLLVGGDVASGALPRDTVEALMRLGARTRFVRGNADREIVEAFDQGRTQIEREAGPAARAAAFAAAQLDRDGRDFLAAFEATVELELPGLGRTVFCHGSPLSDTEIITAVTPPERYERILSGVEAETVVCGHTHRQFDHRVARHRVINAGSVGMPYEGRAGAYWALLGSEVELRRVAYDLEAAMARMRAGAFPDLDEMVTESLLEPADADGVSEFFERQATKG